MSTKSWWGLLLATAACGTLETEHVMTGPPATPHGGDVQIVMEGTDPPPDLQEIAIIQVAAGGNKAELPTTIEALKERARELGCDVVVNVRVDRGSVTMSTTGVCARRGAAASASPAAAPGPSSPDRTPPPEEEPPAEL